MQLEALQFRAHFRDLQGQVNQVIAGRADDVVLMVSGLPVVVKGAC